MRQPTGLASIQSKLLKEQSHPSHIYPSIYSSGWACPIHAKKTRISHRSEGLCNCPSLLCESEQTNPSLHGNQVSRELHSIEASPARRHVIILRDGIGPTMEAQLIVVRGTAGIAWRDIMEITAIMRPAGDLVNRWIQEAQWPFPLLSCLLVGQRDQRRPHGSRSRGAANRYPTSTGTAASNAATAAT